MMKVGKSVAVQDMGNHVVVYATNMMPSICVIKPDRDRTTQIKEAIQQYELTRAKEAMKCGELE